MNLSKSSSLLFRFSLFVTAMTLLLIAAGGLVTSHKAGLAVPDWPQSYGQWMPPMVGNIFWEHGHRMIAGSVAVLTLILCILVQKFEKRTSIRRLAWAALGAVLAQALLGGLTVIFLLPPAVSIGHAILAQTFFCLLIALTFYLRPLDGRISRSSERRSPEDRGYVYRLWICVAAAVYLQLFLGATVRHTRMAIGFHVGWALAVLFLIFLGVRAIHNSAPPESRWNGIATLAGVFAIVQFFLGIGAFLYTQVLPYDADIPSLGAVLFASAHQTNGALVLGTCFLLALRSRE